MIAAAARSVRWARKPATAAARRAGSFRRADADVVVGDPLAQQPHQLHEEHDLLAELAVFGEEIERGGVGFAGAGDLGDRVLEQRVPRPGLAQGDGLVVVGARLVEELVGVAEELGGSLDDFLDLVLEERPEGAVAGDLVEVGLFDDAAGDAGAVLQDDHVGEEAGGCKKEERQHSHARPCPE